MRLDKRLARDLFVSCLLLAVGYPQSSILHAGNNDHTFLQLAIEFTPPGGTLVIPAGTYVIDEPVVIDRAMTLRTNGFVSIKPVIQLPSYEAIRIACEEPDVTNGSTIAIDGGVARNLAIQGPFTDGIQIRGANNKNIHLNIEGCDISQCHFGITGQYHGITDVSIYNAQHFRLLAS